MSINNHPWIVNKGINWTCSNILRETLKQRYVPLEEEDEEVKNESDTMAILARTALCVEWWLERRRKWRHINIVTALATGRGWQAKRPQCFFSIPFILFALLPLPREGPALSSLDSCYPRDLGTRDCDSGQTRPILGLAVTFRHTKINYTHSYKS